MAKTDLTNQRQLLLENSLCSGDHFKAANKAPEIIPCLI